MYVVGSLLAMIEAARAWGPLGFFGAAGLQGGLFVALVFIPIPFGLAIPVTSSIVLFRKAQTARILQLAAEPTDHEKVADAFE